MGETELSPDSGSPEILEGNGSPEEVYDSDRELREGFLEKGMFELYCKGPPAANKAVGRKRVPGKELCVGGSKWKVNQHLED